MTQLQDFNVTLTGSEANSIFMQPIFSDSDILNDFKVMPSVVSSKKMLFANKLEKLLRKYTGCGFKPIGGMNITQRSVVVNKVRADLRICWDEFQDTILEEALKRGVNLPDLTGTIVEEILYSMITEAIKKDIRRVYYFGNEETNDPTLDLIDGFLTVHLVNMVAANDVPYTDSGSGTALAAGEAEDLIKAVWSQAENELKGIPASEKVMYVTTGVYEAYLEDLEAGGTEGAWVMKQNDVQELRFRGIRIEPRYEWTDTFEQDLNQNHAHVVLYTVPSNMVIATDILNPETQFKAWYDDEDEALKIKTRFKLGGNYVHPSLISCAY